MGVLKTLKALKRVFHSLENHDHEIVINHKSVALYKGLKRSSVIGGGFF